MHKPLTFRQKAAVILSSKPVDWFFIFLIVLYMGLVIANIIIDNGCETDQAILDALQALRYVEVAILSLFILEIMAKSASMGLKVRFFI